MQSGALAYIPAFLRDELSLVSGRAAIAGLLGTMSEIIGPRSRHMTIMAETGQAKEGVLTVKKTSRSVDAEQHVVLLLCRSSQYSIYGPHVPIAPPVRATPHRPVSIYVQVVSEPGTDRRILSKAVV
jgi:hypothetical protein